MSRLRTDAPSLAVGLLLLVACSAAGSGDSSGAGTSGTGGAAGMAGFGGADPTDPCVTFETAPCTCGSLPGRSVCDRGTRLPCECAGSPPSGGNPAQEPPGNRRADLMWNWTATMPSGGCRPGHYEGNFEGFTASSLAAGIPIPVAGLSADPTMPALEFDLLAGAGGGELLTVSGGHMKGTANGLFPFAHDIVGELDCTTLKFNASLINGYYMVGTITIMVSGWLTADYDPVTASMVNGRWLAAEAGQTLTQPVPIGWNGGQGTWYAMFLRP